MRVIRLFIDAPLVAGSEISLPADAAHHLVSVLRAKPGQALALFNNTGIEAQAQLVAVDKRKAVACLDDVRSVDLESPLAVQLAIGISRGERFEHVLQKSTELGVARITPLWCERTEVRLPPDRLEKKQQHWQKILESACEQCGRNRVPQLDAPVSLPDLLTHATAPYRLVLQPGGDRLPFGGLPKPTALLLLVGPEGGLSDAEVDQALAAGYRSWTLGPRILRTETAPLAALSVLQYLWGDFS